MTRIAAVALVAVLALPLGAQRRTQSDEVRVPGTDIMLKSGWQLPVHDGCRYGVPLSWQPDEDGAFAHAPDGSSISIQRLSVTNWSAHKVDLRRVYGNSRVIHDDSDHRLWIEVRSGQHVTHHIAVLTGSTVCTAVVELRGHPAAGDETVNRIADLIGPS